MKGKWMVLSVAAALAACAPGAPALPEDLGDQAAVTAVREASVKRADSAKTAVTARSSASPGGQQGAQEQLSMCAAHESVLFSCETAAAKRASLCASQEVGADRGYVYYAYGSPGKPELVFPAGKHPPTDFKRTHLAFAGSTGGYAYSFENNEYRYVIYSISGAEDLEDQGIVVTRNDPRTSISTLSCRPGSVVEAEDVALLDLTLTWSADPELEQHGLPQRN